MPWEKDKEEGMVGRCCRLEKELIPSYCRSPPSLALSFLPHINTESNLGHYHQDIRDESQRTHGRADLEGDDNGDI